jgi:tRNA pseudouridine32 synthase/23S rRNA pseudouridine746 synthase
LYFWPGAFPAFLLPTEKEHQYMSLNILYQDDTVIVLNKPAGLLSVPGRGADKQDSLAQRVQQQFADARVVHRLDCHTSGVMLMARGPDAQRELSRQFHDRETEKHYIAIVHGHVVQDAGVIDLAMRCDIDNRPLQILDAIHGKPSLTHWAVIERNAETTRLKLLPITGRSHQLRVHCRAVGHAIIGDRLYGNEADLLAARMLLHAQLLAFNHPRNAQRMVITAECEF